MHAPIYARAFDEQWTKRLVERELGCSVEFVRVLARIKTERLTIAGAFAKPWPEYLRKEMNGTTVVERHVCWNCTEGWDCTKTEESRRWKHKILEKKKDNYQRETGVLRP